MATYPDIDFAAMEARVHPNGVPACYSDWSNIAETAAAINAAGMRGREYLDLEHRTATQWAGACWLLARELDVQPGQHLRAQAVRDLAHAAHRHAFLTAKVPHPKEMTQ
jgi:hypothetical protein